MTQLLTWGIFQPPGVPFILTPSEFPPWVPIVVLLLPGYRTSAHAGDWAQREEAARSGGHRVAGAGGRAQGAAALPTLT